MDLRSTLRLTAITAALVAGLSACTVDEDQEKALGMDAAAQIDRQLPFVTDPQVNEYISTLGNALASGSDDRALEWRFRVVDSEQVNAVALPGGFVYVNRGLIERAGDASELAGVLGHEIAHVLLRHSAERLEKAQKTNIGVSIVCGLTSLCSSDAARVAINVGGAALFARFSREDEFQADSAAVGITTKAGLDPNGIATMFSKLMQDRERQPDLLAGWFASHPLEEARIAAVKRIVESAATPGRELTRDDPAFHEFQARLKSLPPAPEPPPTSVP